MRPAGGIAPDGGGSLAIVSDRRSRSRRRRTMRWSGRVRAAPSVAGDRRLNPGGSRSAGCACGLVAQLLGMRDRVAG